MPIPPMSTTSGQKTSRASVTQERLLERVRNDKGIPTLGVAISKIVEITSSGEDSVSDLAHFILSDVALTQKILRLSNTIAYKTTGNISVTTISRAIFILGFDTIKANALATLLVDGFRDKRHASYVKRELVLALCASVTAREVTRKHPQHNGEEAVVSALLKNIGRILVSSFDPLLYDKIHMASIERKQTAGEICTELLGCSFERFGEAVLVDWNIPDTIIHSLQPLPLGELKKANSKQEWLKQIACFSEALAEVMLNNGGTENLAEHCQLLVKRFGNALDIDSKQLVDILKHVENETKQLAISLDIHLAPISAPAVPVPIIESDFCSEFMLTTYDAQTLETTARHPSGKPTNARDLLLAGIQDATQMLASNQVKLNDLILLVLETLYGALGFRFATACLRDLPHGQFAARLTIGERCIDGQRGFHFPIAGDATVFHLAMNNNADLLIADALSPKIQNLLPEWHKDLLPDTRSFIVLPLIVDKKPLGFFYADRVVVADEGIPADETALIKTLKGQLLTALLRR